jgi:hypothetical protein
MYSVLSQLKRCANRTYSLVIFGLVVLSFLCGALLLPAIPAQAADTGSRFFPPTGYSVSGKFLEYWETHGGLAIFGYPITGAYYEKDPISGQSYLTQWFERNRFELHPENEGTPYEVLLGLLGVQVTNGRQNEPPFQPIPSFVSNASRTYFFQTHHSLSYGFKAYWETHGGLAIFGYPLTEEFQEQTPQGKFTVQYFERNRFEYHPEKQPPYDIELGLLGVQLKQPNITPVQQDRSSPEALLNSYYNAINRGEYQRAYSYWGSPGTSPNTVPPDYNSFVQGYASTASIAISTGKVEGQGAAGSVYYTIPSVIIATLKNGAIQRFYGCYVARQNNIPIGNTNPPYPLTLYSAKILVAPATASLVSLLNQADQVAKTQGCI